MQVFVAMYDHFMNENLDSNFQFKVGINHAYVKTHTYRSMFNQISFKNFNAMKSN